MSVIRSTALPYELTHLFLVRLQGEAIEAGGIEWRGRVQKVVSGETYVFSGWPELIEHLMMMLPDLSDHQGESRPALPPDKK